MSTMLAEMQALLEELQQSLPTAPPESRAIVEAQIENIRQSMRTLRNALPQMEENKRYRQALSPEVQAFYTPVAGPEIPTWIRDDLTRAQVTEPMLRCPHGATIYTFDDAVGCGIPRGPGAIPTRHGLSLGFYSSGLLRSQGFYDRGLLRWSIEYHANGGRERFGHYADQVEREHLEHGLHTSMTSAGRVVTQAFWHMGRRHGWTKMWEEDGYPIAATLYENGREIDKLLADGSRP